MTLNLSVVGLYNVGLTISLIEPDPETSQNRVKPDVTNGVTYAKIN